MHASPREFLEGISGFLGWYYVILMLMNGVAALYLWQVRKQGGAALFWLLVGGGYALLAPLAASASPTWMPQIPLAAREWVDNHTNAVVYSVGTTLVLAVMFWFRKFFVRPFVAWSLWNLALLFVGLSMADPQFADIVTKPDNVPIVALIFLLGLFTWLATDRAVKNDERARQGQPPLEKLDDEKVLVWPDLVYTEMICMIVVTAILILWGIGLRAPLEEAASSVKTPNPSKAPWYFLGLQEMLVYFDPWYAGVVLPSLTIFGLMAIPYLDFNKLGNGYFTIEQRKFSYLVFQFGFLVLWITLIILGTFLRGPNWNFFGPYEYWDSHKVLNLNNVHLYQIFWEKLLGTGAPKVDPASAWYQQAGMMAWRELPGLVCLGAYFFLMPPLLATTVFRRFFAKMGFIRYMVMIGLLLCMGTLPIKMILRWSFNIKYIVQFPELFLNF